MPGSRYSAPGYYWIVFPKAMDPSPRIFYAENEDDLLRKLRETPEFPGWVSFFNVQDALDALKMRAKWDEFMGAAVRS